MFTIFPLTKKKKNPFWDSLKKTSLSWQGGKAHTQCRLVSIHYIKWLKAVWHFSSLTMTIVASVAYQYVNSTDLTNGSDVIFFFN